MWENWTYQSRSAKSHFGAKFTVYLKNSCSRVMSYLLALNHVEKGDHAFYELYLENISRINKGTKPLFIDCSSAADV